jgi:branched-chain amino acid aminotransferase
VNGKDFILPQISEDAFSKRILVELDGIKYGEVADPHGWIIKF